MKSRTCCYLVSMVTIRFATQPNGFIRVTFASLSPSLNEQVRFSDEHCTFYDIN
jgi:hypothetical protein